MNQTFTRRTILLGLGGALGADSPRPLSLFPGNPRCFLYKGKPVVLITATEHYGAVLNGDFDFVPYLDELARNHLNLSRLFTFYRELASSIPPLDHANTLAPRPGREVMPWKRTGPGRANDGGLKFDLTQSSPEYFARLQRFLTEAGRRNTVVEIVLFCNPYRQEQWSWFPCHPENNINNVGRGITDVRQFMEQHDPTVFEFQKTFVRKMVQELNGFDNIYFEICNETSAREKAREAAERQAAWHFELCKVIRDTEARLPKKHLVAVNAHQRTLAYREAGGEYIDSGDTVCFEHPLIDIITYHYISRKVAGRGTAVLDTGPVKAGNIAAFFRARRQVKKAIVFDENYTGVIRGAAADWNRNRLEAWETIVSGGAGFDHLDWSFTPDDPTGSGKTPIPDGRRLDGRAFRDQLGVLADLWRECGPDRMAPNDDLVAAAPEHTLAVASSHNKRKLHVIYVADSRSDKAGFGQPIRGSLTLHLPKGKYSLRLLHSGAEEWTDLGVRSVAPNAGIELPEFRQDCVLVLSGR